MIFAEHIMYLTCKKLNCRNYKMFTGNNETHCKQQAREAGWKFRVEPAGYDVYCPECAKEIK